MFASRVSRTVVGRSILVGLVTLAVAVTGWVSPAQLGAPLGAVTPAEAAAPDDDVVESNPIPAAVVGDDPADAVDLLPGTFRDLPAAATTVVDPGSDWARVPELPVEVRDVPEVVEPPVPDESVTPPASVNPGGLVVVPASGPAAVSAPDPVGSKPVQLRLRKAPDPADAGLLIELSRIPDAGTDTGPSDSPSPSPTSPSEPLPPSADPSQAPEPVDPSASATPASDGGAVSAPSDPSPSATDPTDSADPGAPAEQPGPGERGPEVPVEVKVSYAGFAKMFGGAWGERLTVTAYPACYAETPELEECSAGVAVETVNNPAAQTLRFTTVDPVAAEVVDPPDPVTGVPPGIKGASYPTARTPGVASAAARVAASAAQVQSVALPLSGSGNNVYAVSGGAGNYGVSGINPSAAWQVAPGSGSFTYSYPFQLPAALGGSAPGLGLSYSSGSVDGMSLSENGQASMAGLGLGHVPGVHLAELCGV